MGDMAEVFSDWKEHKKQQHQEWYMKNMAALNNSELQFTHKDTVCLFRIKGKPQIDFYPHTGRWRIVGKGASAKVFTGGGEAFIYWFKKAQRRI